MATKQASATVYLMEELGDARMRCDQLLRYVAQATKIIESLPDRDAIYERAGHLLAAIPDTTFRLHKALQAVALAANRIDYEEVKESLRPEKVEELERVLKEVRLRSLPRHSDVLERNLDMTTRNAAVVLDVKDLHKLRRNLEDVVLDVKAIEADIPADQKAKFKSLKDLALQAIKGLKLAGTKLAAKDLTNVDPAEVRKILEKILSEAEDLKKGADPFALAALEDIVGILNNSLKLTKQASSQAVQASSQDQQTGEQAEEQVKQARATLASYEYALTKQPLGTVAYEALEATVVNQRSLVASLEEMARFEEGKPADPTENMSPEDAAEWKSNTEEYGDKFKTAGVVSVEDQYRMLKSHPPQLEELDGQWAVQVFSPFVRKYIPMMSLSDKGEAEDSLAFWEKDHLRVLKALKGDDGGKTARSKVAYSSSWTISRRINDVYREFLDQTKEAIQDMDPDAYRTLELTWTGGGRGFDQLTGKVDGLDGQSRTFKFVPEEPSTAAGKILYHIGKRAASRKARFEEGKPADPTENMSPEDAAKWEEMNDEYGDLLKKAGISYESDPMLKGKEFSKLLAQLKGWSTDAPGALDWAQQGDSLLGKMADLLLDDKFFSERIFNVLDQLRDQKRDMQDSLKRAAAITNFLDRSQTDINIKWTSELQGRTAAAILWKYTDEDGKDFYLSEKKVGSVKSPFTGKSFPAKPVKSSMANVGKELKADGAKALNALWKYTDGEGKEFWLAEKVTGSIKSPFTGKSFPAKPAKENLSGVAKELKEEPKTASLDLFALAQDEQDEQEGQDKQAAASSGKEHLQSKIKGWEEGDSSDLGDLARGYRGNYKDLESAAEALAKLKIIKFDGSKVTKLASGQGRQALDLFALAQGEDEQEGQDRMGSDRLKTAALATTDKKVVDAFYDKKPAEGKVLTTDGKTLEKNGLGGKDLAKWQGGKIVVDESRPQVKSDEDILRYMKKSIPANTLAPHAFFGNTKSASLATEVTAITQGLRSDQAMLQRYQAILQDLKDGKEVEDLTKGHADTVVSALRQVIDSKQKLVRNLSKNASDAEQGQQDEGQGKQALDLFSLAVN